MTITIFSRGLGSVNNNGVTITIFYFVSNSSYFLSLNDAALIWIKDKFQNDIIYFGQILRTKETKNEDTAIVNLIVLFLKTTTFFWTRKR
jgi:hypothetical protein